MSADSKPLSQEQSISKFVAAEEGGGFLEKIVIIALFVFIVAAAVTIIGEKASTKLEDQATTVEDLNSDI